MSTNNETMRRKGWNDLSRRGNGVKPEKGGFQQTTTSRIWHRLGDLRSLFHEISVNSAPILHSKSSLCFILLTNTITPWTETSFSRQYYKTKRLSELLQDGVDSSPLYSSGYKICAQNFRVVAAPAPTIPISLASSLLTTESFTLLRTTRDAPND